MSITSKIETKKERKKMERGVGPVDRRRKAKKQNKKKRLGRQWEGWEEPQR
jgi:hypothetical protein